MLLVQDQSSCSEIVFALKAICCGLGQLLLDVSSDAGSPENMYDLQLIAMLLLALLH